MSTASPSLLFLAAARGEIEVLREEINKLSNKSSEIAKVDPKIGASVLHIAANRGSVEAVRLLLEHNADVNVRDRSGVTPLFAAVSTKQTAIVESLLDSKASVNIKDCDGLTALHEAANNGDKVYPNSLDQLSLAIPPSMHAL